MLLDFGKHRGKEVEHTPIAYIVFLAGYRLDGIKKKKSDLAACKWVQEHKNEIRDFARAYLSERCWHCGRKLVPIGDARSNGAAHDDWDGRFLHKKCWSELKSDDAWSNVSDSE